jgi:hypothetical protein
MKSPTSTVDPSPWSAPRASDPPPQVKFLPHRDFPFRVACTDNALCDKAMFGLDTLDIEGS